MKIDEKEFVKAVKPYILKCRPGDWEHAKRVVRWVKKLGKDREDLYLLVTSAYVHDIGWFKLTKKDEKLTREELLKLQPDADKQTEMLVIRILKKFDFTGKKIKTILRIVRSTETYVAKRMDEMILVDSDNLSKTDPDHVREKYAKSDWLAICDLYQEKLPQRIKTKVGKKLFTTKLKKLRSALLKEL